MNIDNVILRILDQRNIRGEKEIKEFLSPKPKLTYDPFLLLNMKEGVDLILDTAEKGGKICIYGDYDADGVTSVTILETVFKYLTDNVVYFVPSRFEDGYGLNKKSIKKISDDGVDLIVTVDCGITSVAEVEYAKELGLDIIVTDHHSVPEIKPNCLIINPKQVECNYPYKHLAGCGIAFKIAQAIQRKADLPYDVIREVLDVVAIGTIGDIVPLTGENRTIVKYGIRQLEHSRNKGISALKNRIFRNGNHIGSEQISFGIVPHLNAAGRMESAKIGVNLFLADNSNRADEIAEYLIGLNTRRKNIQEEIYEEAINLYHEKYENDLFPMIVMNDAHEGITGIVAGKMKDYCYKPVAILTDCGDGNLKATCRSIEKVDIYKVLSQSQDLYVKFGGHKGACGFTISKEKFPKLVENTATYMENYDDDVFVPEVNYDMELEGSELSVELVKELDRLEPFGCCNEKPYFLFRNCQIVNVRYMGKNRNHMRLTVNMVGYRGLTCVLFNFDQEQDDLVQESSVIDICGSLQINQWNNQESIQVLVSDIKSKIQ